MGLIDETGLTPPPNEWPRLVLHRRPIVRRLFLVMCLLSFAGFWVEFSRSYLGHDWLLGLAPKFNMDMENNVPTWFSTLLLASCALVLAAASAIHSRRDPPEPAARFFAVLSAIFVLLSVDEAASLHEHLQSQMRGALKFEVSLVFPWVIAGAIFALSVALWSFRHLRRLPRDTRNGLLWSGAVYCAGVLGVETLAGEYLRSLGRREFTENQGDFFYGILAVTEETLEMTGAILFLSAMLRYLARSPGSFFLVIDEECGQSGAGNCPPRFATRIDEVGCRSD